MSAIVFLGLVGLGTACTHQAVEPPALVPTPTVDVPGVVVPPPAIKLTADSLLGTLTTRQKVAQLVMPWLLGNYTAFDSEEFETALGWVDSLEVGGIIISIGSPLDAASKLNELQRRSHLPLLVAADMEWGSGMRLVGGTSFPMPMAIGATGNPDDAYELGRVTALEARAAGIHMTFSPVSDVNNNPDNPIINTRSFGEDPRSVANLITTYIRGAADNGLYTTAKHFPGHGDTGTDSHIGMPVVSACWTRLDTLELIPFRAAIAAGVTAVMTAHLAMPCIDGDDPPPATMSPRIMGGMLRDSLGFRGLVVTDALTMGAIVSKYGPGETVVKAFLAGSDLLLIPPDPRVAVEAMLQALDSGRITMERLDGSVRRILQLKIDAGLFRARTVALDRIPTVIGRREFQESADDIAARALTLVRDNGIEQFRDNRQRTAVILYAEETNLTVGNELIRELRSFGDTVNAFRLYPQSGPLSYDSARVIIADNPRTIFATSVRFIAGRGHVQMPDSLATLILTTDKRKPALLLSLGSPYLLNQIPDFSGPYLIAWSDFPATERASGRAIAGGAPISGHLPITLSDDYPRGFGIGLRHQ
ncbi:MAG: glycoside hydrolase family 3 N-terminal domain-containing protein [Gemmatimonadales bacterium]